MQVDSNNVDRGRRRVILGLFSLFTTAVGTNQRTQAQGKILELTPEHLRDLECIPVSVGSTVAVWGTFKELGRVSADSEVREVKLSFSSHAKDRTGRPYLTIEITEYEGVFKNGAGKVLFELSTREDGTKYLKFKGGEQWREGRKHASSVG